MKNRTGELNSRRRTGGGIHEEYHFVPIEETFWSAINSGTSRSETLNVQAFGLGAQRSRLPTSSHSTCSESAAHHSSSTSSRPGTSTDDDVHSFDLFALRSHDSSVDFTETYIATTPPFDFAEYATPHTSPVPATMRSPRLTIRTPASPSTPLSRRTTPTSAHRGRANIAQNSGSNASQQDTPTTRNPRRRLAPPSPNQTTSSEIRQYLERNERRSDQLLEHFASIDRSMRGIADVAAAIGNKYRNRQSD